MIPLCWPVSYYPGPRFCEPGAVMYTQLVRPSVPLSWPGEMVVYSATETLTKLFIYLHLFAWRDHFIMIRKRILQKNHFRNNTICKNGIWPKKLRSKLSPANESWKNLSMGKLFGNFLSYRFFYFLLIKPQKLATTPPSKDPFKTPKSALLFKISMQMPWILRGTPCF